MSTAGLPLAMVWQKTSTVVFVAAPWKTRHASFPITQEPGYQNFEYACHEGNYAMFNALSGARAEEKAAAKK